MTRDISSFISWFIQQVVNIGTKTIEIIDSIVIYEGVTMLDFIIAIILLGMFLTIILTIPQNAMNKAERNVKEYKNEQRRKEYKERNKKRKG